MSVTHIVSGVSTVKPLSSIKDMIGSQATKGMHTLARFCDINDTCGVWKYGDLITTIEAYPSAYKNNSVKEGWIFAPADGVDYGYAQLIPDN